jgi:spermidine synthase
VAATAFGTLAYEIALTRIFSVLFRAPYVFLILSIAVCGLGLGAALAAWRPPAPEDDDDRSLGAPVLAFALLLPLPLIALLTIGRPLIAGAYGTAVALVTALPYLAAGLFLARAFRAHSADAGRLYCFDLGGAGLAALVTAQLLSKIGGIAVPMALGALLAVAAMGLNRGRRRLAAGLVLVLHLACLGAQVRTNRLGLPPLHVADSEQTEQRVKALFRELGDPKQGAKVLYTEWSPVARTDVVVDKGSDTHFIWTDGDVPTQMEPFNGDLASMKGYSQFLGFVPYGLRPNPGRVLCIGPGGGLDVLLALLGGAKKIEPVEINPAIAHVVARFRNFYGDLYRRPEIDPGLIIDEGRSYMSRSKRRYDVIYFALAKSATTQQGGMALVDNYLYTQEAFSAYCRHLSDHGLLALVFQNQALTDRCLVTAVAALRALGVSGPNIADRLAYVAIPQKFIDQASTPYQYLMLLSASPFSAQERTVLERLGKAGLQLLYVPGVAEKAPYARLREPDLSADGFARAVAGQDDYLVRLVDGGPWVRLKLSVVTDDRPFYADMAPGLNPTLAPVVWGSLWAGLLALLAAIVAAGRAPGASLRQAAAPMVYFAGLGMGFLLVEVALVQKLVLVLGYPTLSLTVILFTLLVGGAAGGWVANRGTPEAALRRLFVLLPLLAAYQIGLGLAAPRLGLMVLRAALPWRVAAVAAAIAPLGFLMGQPYPTGLRYLGARRAQWVPLAWAVNGVLSVTGSALAAGLASLAGYRCVLGAGAIIYLAVGFVAARWRQAGSEAGVEREDPGGRG